MHLLQLLRCQPLRFLQCLIIRWRWENGKNKRVTKIDLRLFQVLRRLRGLGQFLLGIDALRARLVQRLPRHLRLRVERRFLLLQRAQLTVEVVKVLGAIVLSIRIRFIFDSQNIK